MKILIRKVLYLFVLLFSYQWGISHAQSIEPEKISPSIISPIENVWGKKRLVPIKNGGSLRIFDPEEKLFNDASFWRVIFNQKLPYGRKVVSFRLNLGASHKVLWGNSVLQPLINGKEAKPALDENGVPTFTLILANDGRRFIPDGVTEVKLQLPKSEQLFRSFSFVLAGAQAMDITLSNFQITVWPEDDTRKVRQRPLISALPFGTTDQKVLLLDLDDSQSFSTKSVALGIEGPKGHHEIQVFMKPRRSVSSSSRVSAVDLSHIQEPGNYTISMPSFGHRTIASKVNFTIDSQRKSLAQVRDEAWGAFYWITDGNSGPYKNPHAQDIAARIFEGNGQTRDVSGGWFDAGDYGKYTVNGAFSVGIMLLSGLLAPDALEHAIAPHVESNLEIPDWLDIADTELSWLLKMQGAGGGVNHKATTRFFPNMGVRPEQDKKQKWIMPVSSAATADFSAVMALASMAFKKQPGVLNKTRAAVFAEASDKARHWLTIHTGQKTVQFKYGGFSYGGPYHDDDDGDERFFAVAATAALLGTNDAIKIAIDALQIRVNLIQQDELELDWRSVDLLGFWALKLIDKQLDKKSRSMVDGVLEKAAQKWSDNKKNSPWRTSAHDQSSLYWGSNGVLANTGWHWLLWARVGGNSSYAEDALDQINWFFGRNPLGKTFVTGDYKNSVKAPHFRPWSSGAIELPPGFLVGGPNSGDSMGDPAAEGLKDKPPMLIYADVVESYATNEVAINWQSAWAVYLSLAQAELQK